MGLGGGGGARAGGGRKLLIATKQYRPWPASKH